MDPGIQVQLTSRRQVRVFFHVHADGRLIFINPWKAAMKTLEDKAADFYYYYFKTGITSYLPS